jgi:hypothetical protein
MGDSVVCLICKAVFDNHGMLVKHLFAVHGLGLTDTHQSGFDLDLFPWEDAAAVVAEAEAILSEKECKPGLGVELWWPWGDGGQEDEDQGSTSDDPEPTETEEGGDDDSRSNDELDELAFMAATLHDLRSGRVQPVVQLTAERLSEIDEERPGAEICAMPWAW